MEIITNNQERHFLYGYEVPEEVLNDEYDHLSDDEKTHGFIYYKGRYYHTSDFQQSHMTEWDGVVFDSYFSGVAIKLSDDGETYKIATILH